MDDNEKADEAARDSIMYIIEGAALEAQKSGGKDDGWAEFHISRSLLRNIIVDPYEYEKRLISVQ